MNSGSADAELRVKRVKLWRYIKGSPHEPHANEILHYELIYGFSRMCHVNFALSILKICLWEGIDGYSAATTGRLAFSII